MGHPASGWLGKLAFAGAPRDMTGFQPSGAFLGRFTRGFAPGLYMARLWRSCEAMGSAFGIGGGVGSGF
jgi:hypothetical protein